MAHSFESTPTIEVNDTETVEGEVEGLLTSLPEEIADRWDESHQHLTVWERRNALQLFINHRKKALSERMGSGSDPEHVAVVETSPQAILKLIERIEKGPHEKLGQGAAGHVVASIRYPNVCYKVMFPLEQVPAGTNDIATEADLQDEIAGLGEIGGVRAPKVFSFVHENGTRAITMERLDAVSMRDVLEGKEELPGLFDVDKFAGSLEHYVRALNEKGYYHRDLHDGNVMIDRSTGMPYLIDFGYSKFAPLPDDAYECSIIEDGRKVDIVLKSDIEALKKLRNQAEVLGTRRT